jgi:sugar O-acyltransferase (sialic acid O-acetyltransferase NeuD family)
MKQSIILCGAGGAGRELAYSLSLDPLWHVEGFVDDTKEAGEIINGIEVLGGLDWLQDYNGKVAMCIVNNPQLKRKLLRDMFRNKSLQFPIIKNKDSMFSDYIEFGEGVIVAHPYNYITVNIKIGKFVWINTRSDIGHDVVIGDFTTIFTRVNIGGAVRIGEDCVIGTGVTIKPGIVIGNNVTIGGGAVVVKDVPDNVVIVGNPAKVLRQKEITKETR